MEVLQRTANRGSISTGYEIANSLKFEPDNSESLKWTNISTYATSARKKTFSFSVWFKITELGVQRTIWATSANGYLLLQADGQLKWQQSYGGVIKTLNTNRLFRDTSAWYNVIIAVDSTQSTEANRVRLYVNGVEETSLTSTTYPSQNAEAENVYADHHYLGAYTGNQIYWAGYMANVAFISDAQITPSDVGEFDEDSGIWKPKAYSGGSAPSYFLEFKDSSDLGAATGLDADTLTNITSADQATDTPTNNFCTLNPLSAGGNLGNVITEGATKVVIENSGQQVAVGTIAVTTGKWYWEAKHTSGTYQFAGIISADSRVSGNGGVADSSVAGSDAIALYRPTGQLYYNGTGTTFDTNSYTNGDIIGVALDMDNGTCALYKNGSIMGNTGSNDIVAKSGHASLTGAWTAMYSDGTNGTFNITYEVNFGGYHNYTISSGNTDENGYGNFEYAPPSGYYALCSKNLAEFG